MILSSSYKATALRISITDMEQNLHILCLPRLHWQCIFQHEYQVTKVHEKSLHVIYSPNAKHPHAATWGCTVYVVAAADFWVARRSFKAHGHPHHSSIFARPILRSLSCIFVPPPLHPRVSSRSCSERREYLAIISEGNMCEHRDLGPTRPLAGTKGSRPSWLAGSFETRCDTRYSACVRSYACTAESGGKIQTQRGTSLCVLHSRPCQAIDRRFRPLALPFFVAVQPAACRVPSESTSLSFRSSSNRTTKYCVLLMLCMYGCTFDEVCWVTCTRSTWLGCYRYRATAKEILFVSFWNSFIDIFYRCSV